MRQLQILLPPVYLLLSLLLMGLLHYFLPLVTLVSAPFTYAGYILLVSGLAIILVCAIMFKRAKTAIIPFEKSSKLVSEGIYRYSRNPIYAGMLIILTGVATILGSLSTFLVIPVFLLIIQQGYIKHEERFLEKTFGDDYLEYKARVRRWL